MNRKFVEDLLTSIEDETTKKEIIDKIMEKNGDAIEKYKKEIGVLKNDLKVKEGVIEDLNSKIKANADIDIEAIKKEEFEKGKAEGSKEIETFKKNASLENALKNTKAKDIEIIKNMLKADELKYEEKDGKYEISGLDEQIKTIKESHGYLFEEEKKEDNPAVKTGGDHNNTGKPNEVTSLAGALHAKYD